MQTAAVNNANPTFFRIITVFLYLLLVSWQDFLHKNLTAHFLSHDNDDIILETMRPHVTKLPEHKALDLLRKEMRPTEITRRSVEVQPHSAEFTDIPEDDRKDI